MEPHFIIKDTADVEVIIFSRHVITMKDGANNGTLIEMVNGGSVFVPSPKNDILQRMKESYTMNDIANEGEISVM